jgi:hypothetical protein
MTIVKLREMDERTTYMQQLQEDGGPVVLMNQFNVAPEDVERFLEVWVDDAAFMKRQPGFISGLPTHYLFTPIPVGWGKAPGAAS